MPLAFTRAVSPRLAECALTHLDRQPIDLARAVEQHAAYERALEDAGYRLQRLPPLDDHPDGVFVEDTAILLGRHAVITRPGTASRLEEVDSTAEALGPHFTIHRLDQGTVDGGDVLRIGDTLYVGQSSRTDAEGTRALTDVVAPLGYQVVPVEFRRCLHLKTAATYAGRDAEGRLTLLANAEWVDPAIFTDVSPLAVADDEPGAANGVRAGNRLIIAAGNPKTVAALRQRGFDVVQVDLSELQKAEAGGTCMSLLSD